MDNLCIFSVSLSFYTFHSTLRHGSVDVDDDGRGGDFSRSKDMKWIIINIELNYYIWIFGIYLQWNMFSFEESIFEYDWMTINLINKCCFLCLNFQMQMVLHWIFSYKYAFICYSSFSFQVNNYKANILSFLNAAFINKNPIQVRIMKNV